MSIQLANGAWWAVRVSIGTLVGTSTAGLAVSGTDVLLRWTVALIARNLVNTKSRSVADLLGTIVNASATGERIAFKAVQASTHGSMILRTTVGLLAANGLILATRIGALVV